MKISPEARESAKRAYLDITDDNTNLRGSAKWQLEQHFQSALDKQQLAHEKEISLLREQIRVSDVAFQHLFDTNKKEIAKYEEVVKALEGFLGDGDIEREIADARKALQSLKRTMLTRK